MTTQSLRELAGLALLALGTWRFPVATVQAQGTVFTYQGQLISGGNRANGFFDFEFSLFTNAAGSGSPIGGTMTQTAIGVTNGLFVTALDFGPVFTGNATWLAIGVRSNGVGSFTALTPLQELYPTPYAQFANTAGNLSGTVPLAQLPAVVGLLSDPGAGNFFAGQNSGNAAVRGAFNSGIGQAALQSLTVGSYNTAAGTAALAANTVGSDNTAIGNYALQSATNGTANIALGYNAGNNLASGNNNIYIGNAGASAESGIIRIGTPGTQTTTYIAGNLGLGGAAPQQTLSLNGGINIDQSSLNRGTVNNALTFGTSYGSTSGEGIGSIRTNGYADSFGLDFYTDYVNRMTILNNGNVGIGTDNPDGLLTVKGTFTATTVGLGGAMPQQTLSLNGGMNIDQSSLNRGTVNNALTFGTSYGSTSGEGMGSIRANGYADAFGLDFYTDYVNRMTILNNGNVGIGTNAPSQTLEVNGNYVLIDGGSAANGNGPIDAYIGGDGSGSDVQIGSLNSSITGVGFWNRAAGAWMNVSCSSLTIKGGADLAEPFPISTANQEVREGAVVVIDEKNPGHLKLADRPYDTRVAGVVSGANGINPGIQMQQQGLLEGGRNVALTGRVYVQADTSNGAIKPGDLLTTSGLPGHAMKVTDHAKAAGAILGKAMTGLASGQGLVMVLVTLQ
jgi:hypothetical protein